ncbi:hypothetical protein PanWU01x14_021820, partial [Parasponia andersonii]
SLGSLSKKIEEARGTYANEKQEWREVEMVVLKNGCQRGRGPMGTQHVLGDGDSVDLLL